MKPDVTERDVTHTLVATPADGRSTQCPVKRKLLRGRSSSEVSHVKTATSLKVPRRSSSANLPNVMPRIPSGTTLTEAALEAKSPPHPSLRKRGSSASFARYHSWCECECMCVCGGGGLKKVYSTSHSNMFSVFSSTSTCSISPFVINRQIANENEEYEGDSGVVTCLLVCRTKSFLNSLSVIASGDVPVGKHEKHLYIYI